MAPSFSSSELPRGMLIVSRDLYTERALDKQKQRVMDNKIRHQKISLGATQVPERISSEQNGGKGSREIKPEDSLPTTASLKPRDIRSGLRRKTAWYIDPSTRPTTNVAGIFKVTKGRNGAKPMYYIPREQMLNRLVYFRYQLVHYEHKPGCPREVPKPMVDLVKNISSSFAFRIERDVHVEPDFITVDGRSALAGRDRNMPSCCIPQHECWMVINAAHQNMEVGPSGEKKTGWCKFRARCDKGRKAAVACLSDRKRRKRRVCPKNSARQAGISSMISSYDIVTTGLGRMDQSKVRHRRQNDERRWSEYVPAVEIQEM
ncbi:hypothetical protein EV421DRAFT_1742619 [Armillaria borealis]|uniref:Uncharacterized protein n=1 Tax=Armillaria borealis TaxID=47425 RepID=A0AA39IZF8_9AGAR|nr:hypothetical protein EV421DRAFT_1742619 [Armillaria borealis]